MMPKTREQFLVDGVRVDRELLRVRERGPLGIGEAVILEVGQTLQLLVGRSMPRSLRGVRAVSIFASVDP